MNNIAPPNWARKILISVCDRYEIKDYPTLVWKAKNNHDSSGITYFLKGQMIVRAGYDKQDQKRVLLHELAHIITNQGHTSIFWDTAIDLFKHYKLPDHFIINKEGDYRKGFLKAWRRRLDRKKARHLP